MTVDSPGAVLLTIATVCRDPGAALGATVASVVAFKQRWIRYVVVDGASTDGTADALRGLVGVDSYVSEQDAGIYAAMNKAVALAAPGSYILFLGAGDQLAWLPSRVKFEEWRRRDICFVFGDVLIGDWRFRSAMNGKLRYRNTLHHQGLFVRKRGRNDLHWFDESYRVFADWDFNLKRYKEHASFVALGQVVAVAVPGGVSARVGYFGETFRIVRRRAGLAWAVLSVGYHFATKAWRL